MSPAFQVRRCTDASRVDELLALAHGAFGELAINPPSSVLKETAADFAARLASEPCFGIQDDGRILASVWDNAAHAEARRIGAKRMTLKARIALASNVALFRRHGFVIVAEETHAGFCAPTSYAMELALV